MSKKVTKQADILRYMQENKDGITQKTANIEFHTSRLAVHIDKLRRKGYEIETIMETGRDRYGANQYARYVLKEEA